MSLCVCVCVSVYVHAHVCLCAQSNQSGVGLVFMLLHKVLTTSSWKRRFYWLMPKILQENKNSEGCTDLHSLSHKNLIACDL